MAVRQPLTAEGVQQALRRALAALGDGDLSWLEAPDQVVAFTREPGFTCATNFGGIAVDLELPGALLLRSYGVESWTGELPPNTTVWLNTGKGEREIVPSGLFLPN